MSDENKELMSFPCDFEVKVMGKADEDFIALVLSTIRKFVPELGDKIARSAPSKNGKYLSVTVAFRAETKAQVDDIYQALVAEPRVLYVL